jgi:hypothetical protein
MTKLFKLKNWLTLEDSASHLSSVLQEPVSVADVLMLGIDRHLRLSANFVNGARGNLGKSVELGDARIWLFSNWGASPRDEGLSVIAQTFPREGTRKEQIAWLEKNREVADSEHYSLALVGDRINENEVIEWDEKITGIKGVWDLPMIGGESLDVEHALQGLIGGPEVTKICLEGAIVQSDDGLQYCCIMEHFSENEFRGIGDGKAKFPYDDPNSYYPAGGLPFDAPIVVRAVELSRFVSSIESAGHATEELRGKAESAVKSIDPRLQNSYLRIIRVLLEMQNMKRRGASTPIQKQLDSLGFTKPGEAAIRDIVEKAWALEPDKPQ